MRGINLELFSYVALLSEAEQLPLLVGGDFNCSPGTVESSGYCARSATQLLVPRSPTCFYKKSQSVMDFFLGSPSLASPVKSVKVANQWPSSPHRPVCLTALCSADELVPTLARPKQLPVEAPVGPAREPVDWSTAKATVEGLRDLLSEGTLTRDQRQEAIDASFEVVNQHLERTTCAFTDSTYNPKSARGAPLRIKMVPVSTKAARERRSWTTHVQPLKWLRDQLTTLSFLPRNPTQFSEGQLAQLAADVRTPPLGLLVAGGGHR